MNQKMNFVDLSKASTFFNIDLNVFEIYIIKEFIDIEKMWVKCRVRTYEFLIVGSMRNQKMNLVDLSKASTFFNINLNVFQNLKDFLYDIIIIIVLVSKHYTEIH